MTTVTRVTSVTGVTGWADTFAVTVVVHESRSNPSQLVPPRESEEPGEGQCNPDRLLPALIEAGIVHPLRLLQLGVARPSPTAKQCEFDDSTLQCRPELPIA